MKQAAGVALSLVVGLSSVSTATAGTICQRDTTTAISKTAVSTAILTLKRLNLDFGGRRGESLDQNKARSLAATRTALNLADDDTLFVVLPAGKNYRDGDGTLRLYPNINDCRLSPTIISYIDVAELSYATNTYGGSSGPLCIMLDTTTDVRATETGYDLFGGAHNIAGADYNSLGLFLGYAGGMNYRPWMEPNLRQTNPDAAFEFSMAPEEVQQLGDRALFFYAIKISASGYGSAFQGHTATVSEAYDTDHWARFIVGRMTCLGLYDPAGERVLAEFYFDPALPATR